MRLSISVTTKNNEQKVLPVIRHHKIFTIVSSLIFEREESKSN